MNFPSSPFVEGVTLNGVFNQVTGQPEAIPFGRRLVLKEAGYDELFSMPIGLDKGSADMPFDVPCITVALVDTYNRRTHGRSFPVTDFLDGRAEKFEGELKHWFRPDAGTSQLLGTVFQTVRERLTSEMVQPLPKRLRRTL